jgi:hypothetical protein
MLDRCLATLYQTETRSLKQSVKRNTNKFLKDVMFELNNGDIEILVSQYVITSKIFSGGAKSCLKCIFFSFNLLVKK